MTILISYVELLYVYSDFVTLNTKRTWIKGPRFNKTNNYTVWSGTFLGETGILKKLQIYDRKEYIDCWEFGASILIHAKVPAVLTTIVFALLVQILTQGKTNNDLVLVWK